jgi:xylan 1,4-beta-xylosidase
MNIENPVLPGFHPDPSICRVGDDYYLATSTFQWLPGVRIHHSRDLVHWRLAGYALTRRSQLDLIGVEDNAGVWAPCLSYADGRFHLIFTATKDWTSPYKDTPNYLVTAPAIEGPWSEPVYLNASGFDPSLFHDDDGRKWLVNVRWDHRVGRNPFSGILLQEYSPLKERLIGDARIIFSGTPLGLVEGPHLYRKDGWYWLLTAEGGTGWDHAVTLARSQRIEGPFEVMPDNPLLTSRGDPALVLQRAGHGSLVETQTGQWILAHLCGRPVMPQRKCILGRETALQAVEWPTGQWPRLAHGTSAPAVAVPAPGLPSHPFARHAKNAFERDDFDGDVLGLEWNSLRDHVDRNWASLDARPGWLRLAGRESLYSKHRQSLLARRITHLQTVASCAVEVCPSSFQHMAGLIFCYDTTNYHYLRITCDGGKRTVGIITCDGGDHTEDAAVETALPATGTVFLKGELDGAALRFFFSMTGEDWTSVGPVLDATILSDEHKTEGKFTGAFAGICVQDLTGGGFFADFDWFEMFRMP